VGRGAGEIAGTSLMVETWIAVKGKAYLVKTRWEEDLIGYETSAYNVVRCRVFFGGMTKEADGCGSFVDNVNGDDLIRFSTPNHQPNPINQRLLQPTFPLPRISSTQHLHCNLTLRLRNHPASSPESSLSTVA
jgi:hypothetical protein